jgi:hypothetical protein
VRLLERTFVVFQRAGGDLGSADLNALCHVAMRGRQKVNGSLLVALAGKLIRSDFLV